MQRRSITDFVVIGFAGILLTFTYIGAKIDRHPLFTNAQAADCTQSLQSIIDKAPSGGTIAIPPCVYREKVTISKPLTLDGQGGAEIRGSDVWTGWAKSGSYWTRGKVPVFSHNDRTCSPSNSGTGKTDPRMADQCNWQEQVFFDGRELEQVSSSPKPGEFMVDNGRTMYLADDPTGHTVEVSVRERWVEIASSDVTIRGFTMKHAGNPSQSAALYSNYKNNIIVEHSTMQYSHGPIIGLHHGTGLIIRANDIGYSGHLGVSGSHTTGELVQNNKIHHNNTQGFTCTFECGGMKEAGSTGLVIENNEIYSNYGYGIWCDIDCGTITVRANLVHDNKAKGIVQEISGSAKIYDNKVWNNGFAYSVWGWGAGILVQNSKGVEVYNNIVAWNADGVGIIAQNRSGHTDVSGSSIHNNTIVSDTGTALFALTDAGINVKGANTCANNKVYTQGSAGVDWTSCAVKITQAQALQILESAGIPTKPGTVVTPSPSPSASPSLSPTLTPTATVPPLPSPTKTPTPGACAKSNGDANCDGQVNLTDFEIWRKEFTGALTTKTADFDSSGQVNLTDFEIWRRQGLH